MVGPYRQVSGGANVGVGTVGDFNQSRNPPNLGTPGCISEYEVDVPSLFSLPRAREAIRTRHGVIEWSAVDIGCRAAGR
jgi:hypothetical protein